MKGRIVEEKDMRIVYGVGCCWWESVDKAGSNGGLPCCPHCGSMLFEMHSPQWWEGAAKHEKDGNPDYLNFIKWLRGKCFKNIEEAQQKYKEENQDNTQQPKFEIDLAIIRLGEAASLLETPCAIKDRNEAIQMVNMVINQLSNI